MKKIQCCPDLTKEQLNNLGKLSECNPTLEQTTKKLFFNIEFCDINIFCGIIKARAALGTLRLWHSFPDVKFIRPPESVTIDLTL